MSIAANTYNLYSCFDFKGVSMLALRSTKVKYRVSEVKVNFVIKKPKTERAVVVERSRASSQLLYSCSRSRVRIRVSPFFFVN